MTNSKATKRRKANAGAGESQAHAKGKLGAMLALLLRPEGVTLAAMQDATGWQAHSVRGAMSGAIKKKLGFEVTSKKTDVGRVYRAVKGAGA